MVEQDIIEGVVSQQGFEIVHLEDMPIVAQMELFGNADYIVAAHGAGLANLLFCAPGTRVLELTPDCAFRPQFWLARAKNWGWFMPPCPAAPPMAVFDGDLIVNHRRLRGLLRMLRAMQA